jgi:hypothetical protein
MPVYKRCNYRVLQNEEDVRCLRIGQRLEKSLIKKSVKPSKFNGMHVAKVYRTGDKRNQKLLKGGNQDEKLGNLGFNPTVGSGSFFLPGYDAAEARADWDDGWRYDGHVRRYDARNAPYVQYDGSACYHESEYP